MDHLKKVDNSELSGLTKKNDLVIHSIPKRFINSKQTGDEHHRGMGILILGLGTIIMVAGVVLIYFFVFKNNPLNTSQDTHTPAQINSERLAEQGSVAQVETASQEKTVAEPNGEKEEQAEGLVASSETSKDNTIAIEPEEATSTDLGTVKRIEAEPIKEEPEKAILLPDDQDRDGLYDFEEVLLGTNINMTDSDGDSYQDLEELKKMFNPAGGGKIITNDRIKKYINDKYSYSFYYPSAWQVETTNTKETIILKIDSNQFFQIIVTASADGQSVDDWYRSQFEVTNIGPDQLVYKEGWSGVKSEDGNVYYLKHPSNEIIYALTYSVAEGVARVYENVIEMIISSLDISN